MSGPHVYLSWPTVATTLESIQRPYPVPPPTNERLLRAPFGINKALFFNALRWQIPVFFAATYILTVLYVNGLNRRRGNKPWGIAYTKSFYYFVVSHNVLLSIYSFVTFFAMLRAINHVWPGLHNDAGAAGIADALCKMHGPRGLGDAATYNVTTNIFEVKNTLIKVAYDGNPDPTDVGRLWNEGLAFWGWIFYMSKFYEVVDTAIILAKGKRSPTLQTYHHAGAMLCMWAGIRFMSPPIWMFVFINSFIHGWMYIYYALSAMGRRVPRRYKQLLTSLQIAQIVFGASYAALHLFVQYDIPVSTSYQVVDTARKAVSSVSSAASAASTAVSSFVESPTMTASLGALVKKLLLRAAGEEGVAERIHNDRGELLTPHMAEKIEYFNEHTYETRWRTDWTRVNCIDTGGEAFAIYINLLYLAPLAWLFARFFVRAYTQRGQPRSTSDAVKQIGNSARDAARRTSDAVEKLGAKADEKVVEGAEEARKGEKAARQQMREDLQMMRDGKFVDEKKNSQRIESVKSTAQDVMNDLRREASELTSSAQEFTSKMTSSAQEFASSTESSRAKVVDSAKTSAQGAADKIEEKVPGAKKKGQEIASAAQSSSAKAVESAKSSAQGAMEEIDKRAPEAKEKAQELTSSVQSSAAKAVESAKTLAQDAAKAVDAKAPEVKGKAQEVASSVQSSSAQAANSAKSSMQKASDEVDSGFPATKKKGQEVSRSAESTLQSSEQNEGGSGLLGSGSGLLSSPAKGGKGSTSTSTISSSSGPESEDKATQDRILSSTQPIRPGKVEEETDTDAMGKSGIAVNEAKAGGEGENYPDKQ